MTESGPSEVDANSQCPDFELQCTSCEHVATYAVEHVVATVADNTFSLEAACDLSCVGCEGFHDMRPTPSGWRDAQAWAFSQMSGMLDGGLASMHLRVLKGVSIGNGKRLPASEALLYWRKRVAERPTFEAWLRLSQLLTRVLGRPAAAEPCIEIALKLSPRSPEAWLLMAEVDAAINGFSTDVMASLAELVASPEQWQLHAGVCRPKRAIAADLVDVYSAYRHALGAHQMPEVGEAFLAKFDEQVKAGRNDPCPCGSGKKFKRCCLRR